MERGPESFLTNLATSKEIELLGEAVKRGLVGRLKARSMDGALSDPKVLQQIGNAGRGASVVVQEFLNAAAAGRDVAASLQKTNVMTAQRDDLAKLSTSVIGTGSVTPAAPW